MSRKIIRLESVDSTSTYLKKLALEGVEDGTAVIADRQTAGRGRCGNSFVSEAGGLYCSVLIRTSSLKLSETTALTTKVSVAVACALEASCGIHAGIKWVNDMILNRKKIGGILVEAGRIRNGEIPYVVAGIGMNINQRNFPEPVSSVASSLCREQNRTFDLTAVEDALLDQMDKLRLHLTDRDAEYLEEYRSRCVTLGKQAVFQRNGEQVYCTAEAISEDYGLQVLLEDGTREILRSGEVHVRGIEGYV